MAVDIAAQLQKRLQDSEKATESLSDRLNKLDQFNTQVADPLYAREKPKGYDPLNSLQSFLGSMRGEADVRDQIGQSRTSTDNLLSMIAQLQESEANRALQREKLNQPEKYDLKDMLQIRELAEKQGLKYDPETGELVEDDSVDPDKQQTIGLIDEVLSKDTKGLTGLLRLGGLPGRAGRYTKEQIKQIKSRLSVDQREKMKGSGAISDFEAQLLANSVAALDPSMKDEDFRAELSKIRGILSGDFANTGQNADSLINKYWE